MPYKKQRQSSEHESNARRTGYPSPVIIRLQAVLAGRCSWMRHHDRRLRRRGSAEIGPVRAPCSKECQPQKSKPPEGFGGCSSVRMKPRGRRLNTRHRAVPKITPAAQVQLGVFCFIAALRRQFQRCGRGAEHQEQTKLCGPVSQAGAGVQQPQSISDSGKQAIRPRRSARACR